MAEQTRDYVHSRATAQLHLTGITTKGLAEHIGIPRSTVSHTLRGTQKPSPRFRKGLVELTDEATAQKIIDAIPEWIRKEGK